MKNTSTEWFYSHKSSEQYNILIRCGYPKHIILDDNFQLSKVELDNIWLKESNIKYVEDNLNIKQP